MQVIDTTENELCEFSNLQLGEVFKDSQSSLYFMKTFNTDCGNAVELTSGKVYPFEQNECILPMTAKVLISRKDKTKNGNC